MSYLMEEILFQGKEELLSTLQNLLYPGEPHILTGNEDVDNDSTYKRFCVDDLLTDLFCKTKDNPPLVESIILPKDKKGRLEFLLPPDMLHKIREKKKKDGKPYIAEEGNNNDYMWFFRPSGDNKKIINLIHEIFTEKGGKKFVFEVQKHIVDSFSSLDFSENSKITEYLTFVGDKIIVPRQKSVPANEAFHALLDTGNHDSVVLIITNFLISALLGLRPVQYDSAGKLFYKTYLLNGLGMEYIWRPDLISTPYEELHSIRQIYKNGNYKAAYQQISKWVLDYESSSSQDELALAYQTLGTCLCRHPEKCDLGVSSSTSNVVRQNRMATGADYLEKCITSGKAPPEVHYVLYEYYSGRDSQKASSHLIEAVEAKHAQAVIEYVTLFAGDSTAVGAITEGDKYQKLNDIIMNDQSYSENEVGSCLYLRGRLHQRNGDEQAAEADFIQAANRGHEKARQEVSRKKRMEQNSFPSFTDDPNAPCCFANSLDGNNLVFVSTLPDGEWILFSTEQKNPSAEKVVNVKNFDEFVSIQHLTDFGSYIHKVILLFMSEDEDRNLNECLIVLDKLFNIALRIPEKQRNTLMDNIEIFVGSRYEISSTLIDANINDMGEDIYFKVHIVDETRDSAHQLLCDAPLFLPLISNQNDDSINAVLFGCTETNYRIIKESIGCAYLGKEHPVSITMLGTDAERMERRLRQECPGVFHEPHIECIRPRFISCCIEEEDFPSLIYGSAFDEQPDDEMVKTLSSGNYFVVDLSSDQDSIRFAMELRTWLLRSRGTFDRTPFISVKCRNLQNSYLASHLTLSGQAAGDTYYSRYDLFPFGITRVLYSYNRLVENPRLEEVALQIHMSYYGENDRQAENDYYSFSYNADSSLLTAIGLSYRLFAGGAYFKQKECYYNYGAFNKTGLLGNLNKYADAIKNKEEVAAALEQSRWNGFMLSRGWESANLNQVRAYKDQLTGSSHKHVLAKLHPFIREWGDLDSDDIKKIIRMLQSKFDYDKHPKSTTRKSIKDTPRFLCKPVRDDRKVH